MTPRLLFAVARTLSIRVLFGAMIIGIYVYFLRSAPALAGILTVLIPALFLAFRAMRSMPASRWAMFFTATMVFATAAFQLASFGSVDEELMIIIALTGAGLGLIRGLTLRPKQTKSGLVLPGLSFLMLGWQGAILLTQAMAMTGLTKLVGNLVMVQAFFAGCFGTACLFSLVPLTVHRKSESKRYRVIHSRMSLLMVLTLSSLVLAQSANQRTVGVYEGELDPQAVSAAAEAGRDIGGSNSPDFWIRVSGSRLRIQVYANGAAELLNTVTAKVDKNEGGFREVYEHTFRPASRSFPGQLTVIDDVLETNHIPVHTYNASPRTETNTYSDPEKQCTIVPQADGSILVYLELNRPRLHFEDVPWHCKYIGESNTFSSNQNPNAGLDQIIKNLGQQGDFGNKAGNAGLLAGLLALLAGASLEIASLLATATASNRSPPAPPLIQTPGFTVLSGQEAREWLEWKGFIKSSGQFTDAYTNWTNDLYHPEKQSPLQLFQYYGHETKGTGPGRNDHFLPYDAQVDIVVQGPIKPPPTPTQSEQPSPQPVTSPPKPEPPVPQTMPETEPPQERPSTPPKRPCMDMEIRLAEVQSTGEKLVAESQRLKAQIEDLKAQGQILQLTAGCSYVIDVLSASLTMAATALGGPLGTLTGSMIQNIVAETVKLFIHKLARDDPANFWTNLTSAETATLLSAAVGKALEKAAMKLGSSRMSAEMVKKTAQKLNSSVTGAGQVAYSFYSTTKSAYESKRTRELLWKRLKTLRELRKNTYELIKKERLKRDRIKAALTDCRARHAANLSAGVSP